MNNQNDDDYLFEEVINIYDNIEENIEDDSDENEAAKYDY